MHSRLEPKLIVVFREGYSPKLMSLWAAPG
jgi:hypothetical protein